MSRDLYLTDDKNNNQDKNFMLNNINYLNERLLYLEKIIQSKYSDILYLASEICNVENINLKYDLIDVLMKHGSNLSKYKSELADIKDMLNSPNNSFKNYQKNIDNKIDNSITNNNDIENEKPHNLEHKEVESYDTTVPQTNNEVNSSTIKIIESSDKVENNIDNNNKEEHQRVSLSPNMTLKNFKIIGDSNSEQRNKAEIAREKIITNLDKLISYKENTFNDLIEMVDFHTNLGNDQFDLSKFIESLESQIVELNEYKNNILKNYSLSKSIELGSNGRITFSRIFIEKERLIDKNKEEYIRVLTEMNNLYSEFVDSYLKNINSMKTHLNPEKINSMQNNCGKVIYDLKLIRNLCSSLDKIKSV